MSNANGQFRDHVQQPAEYTSAVVAPIVSESNMLGLAGFQMNHSYEMTMGSMGGNVYNQNFYTNTMQFLFNERLTGRVDLSIAHSPFGNNIFGESQGPQFFIRNAELNYAISDRTHLSFQFRQVPAGVYNPLDFNRSAFNRHNPHSLHRNHGNMFDF
ncbi:hypothetical protein [Cyclonatronum proteinivorum]|uniref:hypothetical protein n=1 Tax=Cyclonatronum proteinivorum TaxID=1457365 RepID=UPI000F54C0FA|nr:hypothetical protein [Cyclonatronum proteinivorum]